MSSPDTSITMTLGAAIGAVIGIYYGNFSMWMGAGFGALLGGVLMLKNNIINKEDKP